MNRFSRRLDRLERKSGTKSVRLIWVESPEELERKRAELQPDDIVVHWDWTED
jgi:hypothetical protein